MEGVSEQIEQAKIFEDGCKSENDNIKAAVTGTYTNVVLKLEFVHCW